MKIIYIGNFQKLWDEEYIAQAFEELGHEVGRITERDPKVLQQLEDFKPDMVLWAKLNTGQANNIIQYCKTHEIPTVCWVWDLYWGYAREYKLGDPMWKADYVFTSDGGHEEEWKSKGIKHECVRQGIHEPECYLEEPREKEFDVVFVGSENKNNKERNEMLRRIEEDFGLHWVGRDNPDEARGTKLNKLFAKSKIIVGDSVYSPNYWSNRVVETLGRGGFLIHVDVPGLKEEYPYLVTYEKDNYQDLKDKIGHYIQNPTQREEIIKKNHEWVKNNYTCKQKCQDLLTKLPFGKKD